MESSQDPARPASSQIGRYLCAAALVLIAGIGVLIYCKGPGWYHQSVHDGAYGVMLRDTGPDSAKRYMLQFPDGAHIEEAQVLYDDRLYTAAADRKDETALRSYLRDPMAKRHRDQATELVDTLRFNELKKRRRPSDLIGTMKTYLQQQEARHAPEARALLENAYKQAWTELAAQREKTVDVALFDKLVVLFRATQDSLTGAIPIVVHGAALSESAVGIIDPMPILGEPSFQSRQKWVARQFSWALEQALQFSAFKLTAAANPETAPIRIDYQLRPTGGRIIYEVKKLGPNQGTKAVWGTIEGTLASYVVDWDITVDAHDGGTPWQLKFTTAATKDLSITGRPDDPPWAPYAILLHSALLGLPDEIMKQLGATPPGRPKAVAFADTVGAF